MGMENPLADAFKKALEKSAVEDSGKPGSKKARRLQRAIAQHVTADEPAVNLDKLRYTSRRVGAAWSRWINEARQSNWQTIDPALRASWTDLMYDFTRIDEATRIGLVDSLVGGMELTTDTLSASGIRPTADGNKFAYVSMVFARENEEPLKSRTLFSGVFLSVSFEDLSNHWSSPDTQYAYRSFLVQRMEENKALIKLDETKKTLVMWLNQPVAVAHFQQRRERLHQ